MKNKTASLAMDLSATFLILGVLGFCIAFFLWSAFTVVGFFT